MKDFIDRSGKGLRPALCIATARALGGRTEDAFPAAAGLEMLHNAFLVHDDIEDGSDSRRGVATMHRRVGVPIAVNTGDSMNALAMRLFRKSGERLGPAAALRILDEVDHCSSETLEGQAMELGWVRDNDLTVGADDYLRLVLKKTAWYSFIHPMRIGALVANADDRISIGSIASAICLGWRSRSPTMCSTSTATSARYGKEINGDLWEGKRTLVLAHALGHANRRRPRLDEQLPGTAARTSLAARGAAPAPDHRRAGSIELGAARRQPSRRLRPREFKNSAFAGVPASPDLKWLRACIDFLVQRDA